MATRFRRVLLVLLTITAAAAITWWLLRPTETSLAPAGERAPAAAASGPELPAPVAAGAPSEAARHEEERPADAPPPAPASDDPFIRWLRDPEQGIVVEGTITVVDEKGVEHEKESGTFVPLALKDGNGGGGRSAVVEEGGFRLHLPPGRDLSIAN